MANQQKTIGLALLLIYGALALAVGQTPAPPSSAVELQQAVTQALILNSDLGQFPLTATAGPGGVVTLNGVLPTGQDRTEAENVAKAVPGVSRVTDDIVVDAAASLLNDGSAADPGTLAATQFQLQDALDSNLALVSVTATVYPKLITLTGYVANAAAKAQAAQLAQQHAPGMRVINAIAVSPADAA